ncbi:hypothetical protein [Halobacillus halophilus]|uniref:hypothetical protein n=1 Tax=Halobacillus halophilus TaxID=1570 RepID=UPI00059F9100|nr:hypothetical protein [Halobacillus halophilus]
MRPLITQNVEELEEVRFLVTILYGPDGHKTDEVAVLYYGDAAGAISSATEIAKGHGIVEALDYWTSTRELMAAALTVPGVAPTMKRSEETRETHKAIHGHRELFLELYGIKPKEKPQQQDGENTETLSTWRRLIVGALESINLKTNYVIHKLTKQKRKGEITHGEE